jgi:predicted nucleic acid-binding protein
VKVLLDTNILLRLAVASHPTHADAIAAVHKLRLRGDEPAIVPQVLYEYWVVATRPTAQNGLGLTPADARLAIDEFLKSIVLLRDERGIFANWLANVTDLEISGKRAHDARLVAAMQRHRLSPSISRTSAAFRTFQFLRLTKLFNFVLHKRSSLMQSKRSHRKTEPCTIRSPKWWMNPPITT